MHLAASARAALWFAGLSLLLSPFFFVIYRMSAFDTLPRDDYAPYLLWLVGAPGGAVLESPYTYRLLSMVAAWPFYELLPAIRFTNMSAALDPFYLRATTALSAMAYCASIAAAMLGHALAATKGGLPRAEAMLAGALVFALGWYMQINAIDPLAIVFILAALCLIERRLAFALLLLLSVAVNEKIALVLAIWLSVRVVLVREDRAALWSQWLAAIGAVAVYLAAVRILRFPGNAYQRDAGSFPVTIAENLEAYLTGRGLLLNVLPALVLLALGAAGLWRAASDPSRRHFRTVDLLVIPALMAVALVLTQLFQAGRIVMHAAPLFIVPAVAGLLRGRRP